MCVGHYVDVNLIPIANDRTNTLYLTGQSIAKELATATLKI